MTKPTAWKYTVALVSVCCLGYAGCQEPIPSQSRPARWTSYTNTNYVKELVVDRNVLWSAGGGLTKYDLQTKEKRTYHRESGLACNYVTTMILNDQVLWIATATGISRYDIPKDEWLTFGKSNGLPDDAITALVADTLRHLIWCGTWEGILFSFDCRSREWKCENKEPCVPGTMISALALNPSDGSLFVGTWGKGLYSYMPDRRVLQERKFAGNQSLDFISALLVEETSLWIGSVDKGLWRSGYQTTMLDIRKMGIPSNCMITSIRWNSLRQEVCVTTRGNGLWMFDTKMQVWNSIGKENGYSTLLFNSSVADGDNLYIGSEGDGVFHVNRNTNKVERHKSEDEIANNKVSAVTPDPAHKQVWIGTEGNGVGRLDVQTGRWTTLNTANNVLSSDVVNSITVDDAAHAVWIGTDNGLVKFEPGSQKHQRYGFDEGLSNIMVNACEFDYQRRLWAAFYIGNLTRFNPAENRWNVVSEAPGPICYALFPEENGEILWLATTQGIVRYNMITHATTSYWDGTEFRSVLFDAEKKELWGGSWERGLYYLNEVSGKERKIEGFEELSILDIRRDGRRKTLWFATNEGAFCWESEKQEFIHFDVANGLCANYVLSIGITEESIWFGTWGGGLSRLLK